MDSSPDRFSAPRVGAAVTELDTWRTGKKNSEETRLISSLFRDFQQKCRKDYFFFGAAAGLAAPVLALVDLAAGFAAGLAAGFVVFAAPVFALVDFGAAALVAFAGAAGAAAGAAAAGAAVGFFAAVDLAAIPMILRGELTGTVSEGRMLAGTGREQPQFE